MKYQVLGDVLVFDATYKNKYLCPLVMLSRVNHHNQTLVINESEEIYVWLMEQFSDAMKGRAACSEITYGDLAMRNATDVSFQMYITGCEHAICCEMHKAI